MENALLRRQRGRAKKEPLTSLAMRVTQMSNSRRNTLILFAYKLDEVPIRVTLVVEMSLREKKKRNSGNNLGSCLFSNLKLRIGRQLHM
jgi:hypothetical protein